MLNIIIFYYILLYISDVCIFDVDDMDMDMDTDTDTNTDTDMETGIDMDMHKIKEEGADFLWRNMKARQCQRFILLA